MEARQSSDCSRFLPLLEQWIEISHEKASAIDPHRPAYDVLLDDYERGMTSARLDQIFGELRQGLVPLLQRVKQGRAPDASILAGSWNPKTQAAFCEEIAKDLGFDTRIGRLDVSVHPFTGGAGPSDVRMTTRFKARGPTRATRTPEGVVPTSVPPGPIFKRCL